MRFHASHLALLYLDSASFTAKHERLMTRFLKERSVPDGGCELPWQVYFDYRDAHKCAPLSKDDMKYAGAFSSCALPKAKKPKAKKRAA